MNSDLKNYVLELIKCTLEKRKPPEKPDKITFEEIYNISLFHKIDNFIFYSIERLENKPDYFLYKNWSENRDMNIVRDIIQRHEFEEIKKVSMAESVCILPVKGFIIKDLYPQSDMRFMSDLDILIDPENSSVMSKIMQSLGYKIKSYGKGSHDVYFKEPCMIVEIHRTLFSSCNKIMQGYYESVWDYALKVSPYYYEFGLEDNFIYITAHLSKHYYKGGTGLRSVIDFYLFFKNYKDKMDESYVRSTLRKIGLYDFYEIMVNLTEVWFENASDKNSTDLISDYIFSSGVYGTKYNKILNQLNEKGKLNYIIKRLFPDFLIMKEIFPVLNKHHYLLPAFWIYRLISSLLTKFKVIKFELEILKKH